jgi:putative RecB family exonuclease
MIAITQPPLQQETSLLEKLTSVVSASRLNTFHTCRLKFYFRYVLGLVTSTTAAFFVGKAVHAALQQWSVARWKGQPHTAESLKVGFHENWVTAQTDDPVEWEEGKEDGHQTKAWALVETYLRDTPIAANEKPEAVEVRVEADLGEHGLPTLIGVLDLVRPGGRIVDFKTTAQTPQPAQAIHRNETQLTAYGLLYRAATGKRESGLELHHLVKTKEPKLAITSTGPVTLDQENKLYRSIESYVSGVEREDFVPSPGLQCIACEFFAECCAWKGGK